MIVADTNLIVHFLVESEFTKQADSVFGVDSNWVAPRLWRSEFCNVLATSIRGDRVTVDQAIRFAQVADVMMGGRDLQVQSADVLTLAAKSGCAAYDCEFVVLAQDLGVRLVTFDRPLCMKFPDIAVSPSRFFA